MNKKILRMIILLYLRPKIELHSGFTLYMNKAFAFAFAFDFAFAFPFYLLHFALKKEDQEKG